MLLERETKDRCKYRHIHNNYGHRHDERVEEEEEEDNNSEYEYVYEYRYDEVVEDALNNDRSASELRRIKVEECIAQRERVVGVRGSVPGYDIEATSAFFDPTTEQYQDQEDQQETIEHQRQHAAAAAACASKSDYFARLEANAQLFARQKLAEGYYSSYGSLNRQHTTLFHLRNLIAYMSPDYDSDSSSPICQSPYANADALYSVRMKRLRSDCIRTRTKQAWRDYVWREGIRRERWRKMIETDRMVRMLERTD
ncbi:hypothetical protein EDD21DRAFT_391264 [Dissophora ornata]|nr:hypothetical protein EDD21DRAFT_391264 [Dissophora ornata]